MYSSRAPSHRRQRDTPFTFSNLFPACGESGRVAKILVTKSLAARDKNKRKRSDTYALRARLEGLTLYTHEPDSFSSAAP